MTTETNQDNNTPKEVPSILEKKRIMPADRVLWILVVMLYIISAVAVYTATSQLEFKDGSAGGFAQKHFSTLCFSAVIMFACYFLMGARFLRKVSWLAFVASLAMTGAAYIFGDATNDAHRWLNIGPIRFQPSELLKIGTVMLLAARLSQQHHHIKSVHLLPSTFNPRKWSSKREWDIIRNEMLPIVVPIALACGVILPAHTSSAIHLYIVSMLLLFIAGIKGWEIIKLSLVALIAGVLLTFTIGRGNVVMERLAEKFGRKDKAQTEQVYRSVLDKYSDSERSQMAIHNGGFLGVGAGRSVMRARLTHPESDYLFAIVVEEFGLILSYIIAVIYLWIFSRALRIFVKCEWLYAGLLVVGLALIITTQGFLHIGVTIGFLPETGQNLPFLTQGRTGMVCTAIALGLMLSISRQVEQGTIVPPSQKSKNNYI